MLGQGDLGALISHSDVRLIASFTGAWRQDAVQRVIVAQSRRCELPAAGRPLNWRGKGTACRPRRRLPMKLTPQQIETFHREGWLFLPELFTEQEVALLRHEAVSIYDGNRAEVWREKSGAPRTAFAAHTYNEAFRLLGAHPRLIRPVEQIFGEQLYMHQFKINAKAAFTGEVWQWHQDYGTWKRDDGMPEPRAMNISVFLDEVMHVNGPLLLVPRSQNAGDLKASHDTATTSYPLWTLDDDTVTRLVEQGGLVAPIG